jgi:hypothetical protein
MKVASLGGSIRADSKKCSLPPPFPLFTNTHTHTHTEERTSEHIVRRWSSAGQEENPHQKARWHPDLGLPASTTERKEISIG